MTSNWREPYRSRDMAGEPGTAGHVAWEWINDLAMKAKAKLPDPAALFIEAPTLQGDGSAIALFHSTKLLAVATVFRDRLNFSILVRWMDADFAVLIDDRPRCGCHAEKIAAVQSGGTCGRGGCPYGGDF